MPVLKRPAQAPLPSLLSTAGLRPRPAGRGLPDCPPGGPNPADVPSPSLSPSPERPKRKRQAAAGDLNFGQRMWAARERKEADDLKDFIVGSDESEEDPDFSDDEDSLDEDTDDVVDSDDDAKRGTSEKKARKLTGKGAKKK